MKNLFLSMLFAAICSLSMAQTNFDTVKIRPVTVTEKIYMLKGAGGNIGVLTGKDGVLLIDDQYAPLSEKIMDAVKSFNSGDIRVLINTHVHGDHTGGNENFRKAGVIMVAQDQVLQRMTQESVVRGNKVPPRPKEAWPMITFPDRINFHWNDQDIEVYHLGTGHTDGDAVIYFKQANVFHTGDMFVRYGFPFVDMNNGGSVNGFISFLDKLIPMMNDQSKIIPGHGELAIKADVIVFRDRLKDIRDRVATALKQGKKVEDIPGLGITDKYDKEWGQGFIKGKDFVLMTAEELSKK